MGEIVELKPSRRARLRARAPEPAKVLLYTGVRVERLDPDDGRPPLRAVPASSGNASA